MSSSSIRIPFYSVLLLLMALSDDYRIKTKDSLVTSILIRVVDERENFGIQVDLLL